MMVFVLPDMGNIVTAIYAHIKETTTCKFGILSQCIQVGVCFCVPLYR